MRLAFALAAALGAATFGGAVQAQDQTLADIRQELSVLFVEIQRLRGQLNTTGGADGTGGVGGGTIDRVNAIEAEVQRLTALTERLQIEVDGVVRDGTNRIGDLEFRLCELEPACDVGSLGDTPFLGGVTPGIGTAASGGGGVGTTVLPDTALDTGPVTGADTGADTGGASLAVAEEADFNAARTAFEAGSFADASILLQTFTETYPGSPLSPEAHYLRGQAEANQGRWSPAARAFLAAFTERPDGQRAPEALTALGVALAQLGQMEEACVTLAEVSVRYPGTASVAEAQAERGRLGCQ